MTGDNAYSGLEKSSFPAYQQQVPVYGVGGGENVCVASVFQFETFSQFLCGEREIADSHIRLANAVKCTFQLFLVHGRNGCYDKTSAGKKGGFIDGNEKIGVLANLADAVSLTEQ